MYIKIFLHFCFLLVLGKMAFGQDSLILVAERDVTLIIAAVEGPFLKNADTLILSAETPIFYKIEKKSNHWVYALAIPNQKEKFYFVMNENKIIISVPSNILFSRVQQSPINDQVSKWMQSKNQFQYKLDSVYKVQYEAFASKNMDGYHSATKLADSITRYFGEKTYNDIIRYPDSLLSQFKLIFFYHYFPDNQLLRVLDELDKHGNLYMVPSQVKKVFKAKVNTQPGKKAPDFWMTTTKNERINFAIASDYPSFIIFSASWCKPCKTLKDQLAQKVHDKSLSGNVKVYVISTERDENGIKLAMEHAFNDPESWNQILLKENDGGLTAQLNISVLPTVIVLNKYGVIQHIYQGYSDVEFDAMINAVSKL